jgi:hypothetical protein
MTVAAPPLPAPGSDEHALAILKHARDLIVQNPNSYHGEYILDCCEAACRDSPVKRTGLIGPIDDWAALTRAYVVLSEVSGPGLSRDQSRISDMPGRVQLRGERVKSCSERLNWFTLAIVQLEAEIAKEATSTVATAAKTVSRASQASTLPAPPDDGGEP